MIRLLLTVFGGPFGLHKFAQKKWIPGIIYLFTAGLFGIGWIIDSVLAIIALFKPTPTTESIPQPTEPPIPSTPASRSLDEPVLNSRMVFSNSVDMQNAPNKIEKHHVAGVSFRQKEIEGLGFENDDFRLSKKECIDCNIIDERIYKINFDPINVSLEEDPENVHDSNAIKVIIDNVHVGYIKSGSCSHIKNILKSGKLINISAKIMGGDYKVIHLDEDGSGKEIYSLEKGHADYHITLSFVLNN